MTALPKPPRIQRLALTDFRAFPGPAPRSFGLEDKNLLVYGENGAGKSSLFHALREFFSLKPSRRLDDYRNVFSKVPPEDVTVSVEFNDGGPKARWYLEPSVGVVVEPFKFAGVTYRSAYYKRDRIFNGMELKPEVTFRTHPEQGELPLDGGNRIVEGGKQLPQGGKRSLPDLPPELAARLPQPRQRLGGAALRALIRELCGWQALRGEELATLLHKDLKYLRNKHLTEMVQTGELAFLFPESPNHALQAYKLPTRDQGQ